MEKKTYLVFFIQAFDAYSEDKQRLLEVVELELWAESEEQAEEKAKQLVKKNYYRVNKIVELQLKDN